jgi:hypothetical protein
MACKGPGQCLEMPQTMSMKVLMAGVLLAAGSAAVLSSPQAMRVASDRLAEFLDTHDEDGSRAHRGRRHRAGADADDREDEARPGSRMTRGFGGRGASEEDRPEPRSGRFRSSREEGGDARRGASGRAPEGLDGRFARLDRNGDGIVDAGDFQARASEIAAGAARRFLRRFDANGDGRVSREEFTRGATESGERFADLELDGAGAGDGGEPRGGRGRGNVK